MRKFSSKVSLNDVEAVLYQGEKIEIEETCLKEVENCYNFLEQFSKDKIIYGINTGFGPMAQYRINDKDLEALQYNIIRSHSAGAGKPLEPIYVKSAMIARLCTFLQAKSGVHLDTITTLLSFINNDITPFIPEHGSVGASGDLVQLAHISLCLIGEGFVFYKGEKRPTAEVMKELNISPLRMHIREGLSICNGTSVMTGIGVINLIQAKKLLHWSTIASVMMNEIASSYDDFMSVALNKVRRQNGQQKIAEDMRNILKDSKLMRNREAELYKRRNDEVFSESTKVQAYYSLRCVPQILGPIAEEIESAERILMNEINSACDNPIIDPETKNVYHGGNFHGDYISFQMDKLKIAITKLTILTERQLNYLCHDRINGILPPFVNLGKLGLNYGVQAMQFTATSTTAESLSLSFPNYVHSIPNNNDNQDVVSMGTNSALIARSVINNAFQVLSIHFISIVQGIDCLKISDKLSSKTKKVYDTIRSIVPQFIEDTSKYQEIEAIENYLKQ